MRLVSFRSVRDARATPPPYESTQPAPTRADRKSTRLNLQSRRDLVCRLLLEKKKPRSAPARKGPDTTICSRSVWREAMCSSTDGLLFRMQGCDARRFPCAAQRGDLDIICVT